MKGDVYSDLSAFTIIGGLPFINIGSRQDIRFGGLIYWKGSDYKKYLKPELHATFPEYCKWSSEFGVFNPEYGKKLRETGSPPSDIDTQLITHRFPPEKITFVSISNGYIPKFWGSEEKINSYLFDSLFLLYFASSFNEIRTGGPPATNPFLFVRNAVESTISDPVKWQAHSNQEREVESDREIERIDEGLLEASGKLLECKYFAHNPSKAARYIRAIRYYCGRFFDKYRAPIKRFGTEPEDAVFLTSAFEALAGLHEDTSEGIGEAIGRTIKSNITLRFKKQELVFDAWVRSFYNYRSRIVHGDEVPESRWNPSFNISPIGMGFKLFPPVLYSELTSTGFISPSHYKFYFEDEYDLYFWSEESLLGEIKGILEEAVERQEADPARMGELQRLMDHYHSMVAEHIEGLGERLLYVPPRTPIRAKETIKGLINHKEILKKGKKVKLKETFEEMNSEAPNILLRFMNLMQQ